MINDMLEDIYNLLGPVILQYVYIFLFFIFL